MAPAPSPAGGPVRASGGDVLSAEGDSEHLVRIHLKDGSFFDMYRIAGGLKICRADQCVEMAPGSAAQAMAIYALLEPLGERIEFPDEEESSEPAKD